jgi:hypothetical protein
MSSIGSVGVMPKSRDPISPDRFHSTEDDLASAFSSFLDINIRGWTFSSTFALSAMFSGPSLS